MLCFKIHDRSLINIMPKGYMVIQGTVFNRVGFRTYVSAVADVIKSAGGRCLVNDLNTDVREGNPGPFTILIEFDSKEAAQKVYESPQYQELIMIRRPYSSFNFSLVKGLN